MGGSIQVDSTPGQGCRFEFAVPSNLASSLLATPDSTAPSGDGAHMRLAGIAVLAAEDNPINQMVL